VIKFSRRKVIRQMGAWPLLWPLLRGGRAEAQGAMPTRVIIIYSPNGPIMENGPASGTENAFNIHEWWSPLNPHKADGVFFRGMHQAGVHFGKHNEYGHQSGGTGALTARATEGTNNATGPSIDQFIGQELQKKGVVTPKRSLLWGLHNNAGHWGPWYEAAGKPTPPMMDPYKALADIAPGLKGPGMGGGTPVVDRKLLRKRFVLDSVYKDCKEMTSGLGSEAKTMLDFHCGNIESLEQSVAKALDGMTSMPVKTLDCSAPAKPNTMLAANANFGAADNRDELMQAFTDLAALAFSCDVTRVIGLSFGDTASRFAIPAKYMIPDAAKVDSGDAGPQHHAWTHTYNQSPEKRFALKTFYTWYSTKVAALIAKLKATPDANGKPLFDSTLILWTSELGHAEDNNSLEPHPNQNIPVMLFGNSQGAFKTNRLFVSDNSKNSTLALHKLFVSVIQHAGLTDVNAFGNQGTGALDWLKG
jgi:hypothetical protein